MFAFLKGKSKRDKQIRIFNATDIHGSDICFRKFCNALDFYKVDMLILGGDWTSKMVVPIIPQQTSRYCTMFSKKEIVLDGEDEMKKFAKKMGDMGFYPKLMSQDEFDAIQASPEEQTKVFRELMIDRVYKWGEYATEKLKGRDTKIYCAPGNDDELFIDQIIEEVEAFELVEDKRIILADGREMITCAWSNPTPWQTPRECSEDELYQRLEPLAKEIQNLEMAIFNLHAPPYNTRLDECPDLDEELKPKTSAGQTVFKPVGSTSVRKIIETFQPLFSFHGHIHEGKGTHTIGRTTCINPGSQYNEGVLQGVVVTLESEKVVDIHFTTG